MLLPRRSVLAGAALLGCSERAAAGAALLYIAPEGSGRGASWSDAASLEDLGDLVDALDPDGEILVAADRGEYVIDDVIELRRRNARGLARIRGVNSEGGEPMAAVVRGNRTAEEVGTEAFRLLDGADQLSFSHFDFRAIGNGCFRVAGAVNGLTIEDCGFDDIYRFLENTALDDGARAGLKRFAVRRCRGQRVERGFSRVRYDSRDGVFEDCHAQGRANEGGHLPVGCALDDRASNIVYRRCVMEGFQQWRAGDYWNGDGFSDEGDNRGIRYEQCTARGSTDGGFDCKSRDVVLSECVAEDNKRNFRIWSPRATLTGCTSRNPNFRGRDVENASACHIWVGEDAGRVRLDGLVVEDDASTAILEFDRNDGEAEIRGVTLRGAPANWGNVDLRTEGEVTIAEAR